jgi:DNA-binding transcriptional MerR regulator
MKVKTGEVVARTGLSRQTISQYATLGYIPGAERTRSGRWRFSWSQHLADWMTRVGRVTQIRRRRQILHQDEADIRRLERKAAKLRTTPGSRHGKRRLLELTRTIAEKRAALTDYLTTPELAKATGRSRRWITGRARSIPGARRVKNRFVFEKSQPLSDWIHRERRLRGLERRLAAGDIRFPRSRRAWLLLDTYRYEQTVLREANLAPFSDWPKEERREFEEKFQKMVKEIQRATEFAQTKVPLGLGLNMR